MTPASSSQRLFLDTFFALALLNSGDEYHAEAKVLFGNLKAVREVWVTEAILCEIGNVSQRLRHGMVSREHIAAFIDNCYQTPNFKVVPVDTGLFRSGVEFYRKHADKEWGITDCISFVVMQQQGIAHALTGDHHFEQAGFVVLFRK